MGSVMTPWLLHIYIDGVVREIIAKMLVGRGFSLVSDENRTWILNQLLFAYDMALLPDSEEILRQLHEELGSV